ncbi:GCN5-related N-acetyltransferase [Parvibaculum lavamentivorans DS-1]|uniref:GCN5-related N-acetyltransferase n=1 Tax=Parvibaculum lavamentivorans (strain DS-1 / DSM 13023 / NCIMB 13966) TaxID=402881 RepID=A7HZ79_PARL1|nr:GNAT family N-acetyltransferase [Parvibaculum lavamentivorans]ABS65212.1 GCN5-related N-acetyltransferase [Parvibaculum lavamentivorans DS-1]
MPRAIGKSSVPQLARLHALCFEEAWGEAAIAGLLAMPGVFGFMWGPEAAPEGFVLARLGGGEAEILTICVAPALRRAGTGRLLLQAAAAYALASGADALFLEVAEDNPAALRLYERFGFTSVGIRPAYYARGTSRVAARTLRLDLSPSIALS